MLIYGRSIKWTLQFLWWKTTFSTYSELKMYPLGDTASWIMWVIILLVLNNNCKLLYYWWIYQKNWGLIYIREVLVFFRLYWFNSIKRICYNFHCQETLNCIWQNYSKAICFNKCNKSIIKLIQYFQYPKYFFLILPVNFIRNHLSYKSWFCIWNKEKSYEQFTYKIIQFAFDYILPLLKFIRSRETNIYCSFLLY